MPVMEVKSIFTGRRGVSLPFTDYCEPIIHEDIQLQDVMDDIIHYGKECGWKFLELRGGERFLPNAVPSAHYFCHTLDLSQNEERILSSFRKSNQRNVKKAISKGVEVKLSHSFESIDEFYRLNCLTRKQHGLPPQPYHFFRKVHDHVLSENLGFVVLASYEKKNIAGAVYFHFGKNAI